MRSLRLLFPIAVVAAGLGVGAAAAQAHNSCINHGDDTGCSRAQASYSHYWLDGCDREADGNRARTNWKWQSNETLYHGSWDENGADPGCANDPIWFFGDLAWHRICEENVSCSSVRTH
jgi:hypothetical protein